MIDMLYRNEMFKMRLFCEVPQILLTIFYQLWTSRVVYNPEKTEFEQMIDIPLIVTISYFLLLETTQLYMNGLEYLQSLWNYVEITMLLNLLVNVLYYNDY